MLPHTAMRYLGGGFPPPTSRRSVYVPVLPRCGLVDVSGLVTVVSVPTCDAGRLAERGRGKFSASVYVITGVGNACPASWRSEAFSRKEVKGFKLSGKEVVPARGCSMYVQGAMNPFPRETRLEGDHDD